MMNISTTAHRSGLVILLLLCPVLVGGCRQVSQVDSGRTFEATEYSRLFDAAIITLKDQGFEIDRQDFRFGHVSTKPLEAPVFVEFWHTSNTTAAQAVESTVNDQRRVARVLLEPVSETEGSPYTVRVEVQIQRKQMPTRHLTGSTTPRRIVNTLHGVPHEMQQKGIPAVYWRNVGRDELLEKRLLQEIHERASQD